MTAPRIFDWDDVAHRIVDPTEPFPPFLRLRDGFPQTVAGIILEASARSTLDEMSRVAEELLRDTQVAALPLFIEHRTPRVMEAILPEFLGERLVFYTCLFHMIRVYALRATAAVQRESSLFMRRA